MKDRSLSKSGTREETSMNLKGRNFLTLKDFTPEEITYLLDLSADLKEKKKNGTLVNHYTGKNMMYVYQEQLLIFPHYLNIVFHLLK